MGLVKPVKAITLLAKHMRVFGVTWTQLMRSEKRHEDKKKLSKFFRLTLIYFLSIIIFFNSRLVCFHFPVL